MNILSPANTNSDVSYVDVSVADVVCCREYRTGTIPGTVDIGQTAGKRRVQDQSWINSNIHGFTEGNRYTKCATSTGISDQKRTSRYVRYSRADDIHPVTHGVGIRTRSTADVCNDTCINFCICNKVTATNIDTESKVTLYQPRVSSAVYRQGNGISDFCVSGYCTGDRYYSSGFGDIYESVTGNIAVQIYVRNRRSGINCYVVNI